MGNMDTLILAFVVYPALVILAFLVFRAIVLWYWKISAIAKTLESIDAHLGSLKEQTRWANDRLHRQDSGAPPDGEPLATADKVDISKRRGSRGFKPEE